MSLGLAGCAIPSPMSLTPGEDICASARVPGVRWIRSLEKRDVERTGAWCATVGSPRVRPLPASDYPALAPGEDLAVVSWNTFIGGGDLLAFMESELGLRCNAAGAQRLGGFRPFVLMLQEVYRYDPELPRVASTSDIPDVIDPHRGSGGPRAIDEVADLCGLALAYVPSARNGSDSESHPSEDKGNALLASTPLEDVIAIDLPFEGGRKTAVAATVRLPGKGPVRFVTAHLDVASTLTRTVMTGNQTRLRQAKGLSEGLEVVEEASGTPVATVLGGDFNTWSVRESTIDLLRRDFPDSPPWDGAPTVGVLPLDHIFFRRNGDEAPVLVEYARMERGYGSDHLARRALLRPTPAPTRRRAR